MKPERTVANKIRWNPYGSRGIRKVIIESGQDDDDLTEEKADDALDEAVKKIIPVIRSYGKAEDSFGTAMSHMIDDPYGNASEIIRNGIKPVFAEYAKKVLILTGCKSGVSTGGSNARFTDYVSAAGGTPGEYAPTKMFDRVSKKLDLMNSDDTIDGLDNGISADDMFIPLTGGISICPVLVSDIANKLAKLIPLDSIKSGSASQGNDDTQIFKGKMNDTAEAISRLISKYTKPSDTNTVNRRLGKIQWTPEYTGEIYGIVRDYIDDIITYTKKHKDEQESDKHIDEFNRYLTISKRTPDGTVVPGPKFDAFIDVRNDAIAEALGSVHADDSDEEFKYHCLPICKRVPEIAAYLRARITDSDTMNTDFINYDNTGKSKRLPKVAEIYKKISEHKRNPEQYLSILKDIDDTGNVSGSITPNQQTVLLAAKKILEEAATIDASIGTVEKSIDDIYTEAPSVNANTAILPKAYMLSINDTLIDSQFDSIPELISQSNPISTESKANIKQALTRIANECDAQLHLVMLLVYGPGASLERAALRSFEVDQNDLSLKVNRIINEYQASHNKRCISFVQDIAFAQNIETTKSSPEVRQEKKKTNSQRLAAKYERQAGAKSSDDAGINRALADAPISGYPEISKSAASTLSDIADGISDKPAAEAIRRISYDLNSEGSKIVTLADLAGRIADVCGLLGNGNNPAYRPEINGLRGLEQSLIDTAEAKENSPTDILDVVPGMEEYPIRYGDDENVNTVR